MNSKILKIDKAETVFILDKATRFLADRRNTKKQVIISSKKEFQELLDSRFSVKEVIILVELDWNTRISSFYGYEVAKQLMESSSRTGKFNLLFMSRFSREVLFQIYQSSNRIFITKFNHAKMDVDFDLFNLSIPEYSERKFNYIKNYCLISAGVIDRLIHDVRNLRNSFNNERYKSLIVDLYANRDVLSSELVNSIDKLSVCSGIGQQNALLDELLALLHRHQCEISNPDENYRKKSRARLLLVEDNNETLEKLKHTFANFFSNIETSESGSNAFEILKKKGKQIDAVLTDMEILIGVFDDEKQGIDILELCMAEYPHIVARVITALPKNAVKQLIGMKPSNIIYKGGEGGGVIHPLENLNEFVEKIDEEVKQRSILRSMAGPVNGRFGICLTKQLYLKKMEDREEYNAIWKDAISLANRFIANDLNDLVEEDKVSVAFGKKENGENGWKIIRTLLTHRLIVLYTSSIHHDNKISFFKFPGGDGYVDLPGFQIREKHTNATAYFTTNLGFSIGGAADELKKGGVDCTCKIIHQNLFPEERSWLEDHKPGVLQETILEDIDFEFASMFVDFFNACYGTERLDENTTLGEAQVTLDKFILDKEYSDLEPNLLKELSEIFNEYYEKFYSENIDEQLVTFTESLNHIFSIQLKQ